MADQDPEPNASSSPPTEVAKAAQAIQDVESVLDPLPMEARQAVLSIIATRIERLEGPLPPPHLLAGYERVMPGLAERIVRMAEQNGDHRRQRDTTLVDGHVTLTKRGQIFGFVAIIVLAALGTFLAMHDKTVVASVIFGTTVVGVLLAYLSAKGRADASPPKQHRTDDPDKAAND